MACKCNKCDPQKACGCTDSSLTTPCTYSDCSVGSERCADVQCAECVSYCGTTFQIIDGSGNVLKVETGQRLDSIIQRLALIAVNGFTACSSDITNHSVYNLFVTDITSTSALIQWNGVSTASTGLQVQSFSGGVWNNVGSALPITQLSLSYGGLTPSTSYRIRIRSLSSSTPCDSVEVLFDTLAS